MLLRFDAYNGAAGVNPFSEIADEVMLLDIIEEPAQMEVNTSPFAMGHGMRVGNVTRKSLNVRLVYVIRTQDPVRRAAVHDLVVRWASGVEKLAINTRPGMVLAGRFYTAPAQGSALQWTQEQQITFTAYDVPYWQNARTESLMASTFDFEGGKRKTINPNCTGGPVPVSLMIINDTSRPITEVYVEVGQSKIRLKGLDFVSPPATNGFTEENPLMIESANGKGVRIYTTGTGSAPSKSYLHARTADSSDALLADNVNPVPVYFEADQSATCWFTWPRWWA